MELTEITLEESVLAALDDDQDDAARDQDDARDEMGAVKALKYIDDRWYKKIAGKKARWMDLIGDYAGNERFILDGKVTVRLWGGFC